jgi:hypothetical protein
MEKASEVECKAIFQPIEGKEEIYIAKIALIAEAGVHAALIKLMLDTRLKVSFDAPGGEQLHFTRLVIEMPGSDDIEQDQAKDWGFGAMVVSRK